MRKDFLSNVSGKEVDAKENHQPIVYNVDDLPRILGISRATAYQLAHRGDFPAIRLSARRIVVPKAALERWLEMQAGQSV